MKAIGKGSVSSALLVFLNVASAFLALILVVTTAVAVFGAKAGMQMVAVQIESDGSPNVDVGPNVHMSIPVSFNVDARTIHVTAPAIGIQNAEVRNAQGLLRFVPQGGAFLVANLALVIALLALALWMLAQLRALFRALRDGQPFAPQNAMRVRRIAWTVIAAEVLRSAVVYFENVYAMTYFVADGLRFDAWPHLNLFAIINGLIILVISEVFRAGTRLDEDQSLTV
jgi:amino acid transporter